MTQINTVEIVEKGPGWLCVEKPAGMSVHNEPGHDLISILEAQIRKDQDLMNTLETEGRLQIQPVHRLDLETSGLIIIATEKDALRFLGSLFQAGEVKKNYIALVHGSFNSAPGEVQVWDTPLSKEAGGRTDPRGPGKRVRSETRYRVIEQSAHYALLEIELITGRKHQIRRHAKIGGHPVTGDKRYGSKRSVDFLRKNLGYDRLGLHSFRIEFSLDNVPVTITSRAIPISMQELLAKDR